MEPVTAKAQGCVCVPPVLRSRRLGVRKTPTVGGGLHLLRRGPAQLVEGCQQLLGDRSGIVFKVRFAPAHWRAAARSPARCARACCCHAPHPTQETCVDEGALPGQRHKCKAADHHGPARPHAGTAEGCAAGATALNSGCACGARGTARSTHGSAGATAHARQCRGSTPQHPEPALARWFATGTSHAHPGYPPAMWPMS